MAHTKPTPAFRKMADMIKQELVVVPLVEAFLHAAKFPKVFDVTFRDEGTERKPDGYFHPSTHPTWPERLLFYYLTRPDDLLPEEILYENRMAMIMGTAVHSFIQTCMIAAGILIKPKGTCLACGRPHGTRKNECDEFGAIDKVLGRRGHMDGILEIQDRGWGRGLFEFKCLALGTPVSMADGSLKPVEKVAEGDLVLAWDEQSQSLATKRITGAWDNGIVPVWTIRTKEGREIGSTDEHPFWTQRGWVFAKDLQIGDRVKVADEASWWIGPDPTIAEVDEARFMGLLVGDGGLTTGSIKVTNTDEDILDWLNVFAVQYGCRLMPSDGPITYRIATPAGSQFNPLLNLLRREELMGKGSREKRVPHAVWTGGPEAWKAFLSGYFDADGTVVTRGSYPHISWASVNRDLLADCQMLLSYLGVRSTIAEIKGKYKGEPHQSWRLLVRDAVAVRRVMEVLDLHSAKAAPLAAMDPKDPKAGHHLTAVQGWDTVSGVTEGDAAPTIALEVDGGTHITAGIVTHNTINPKACFGLDHHNLEWLKEKKPDYYAQVQDYLDMTGMQKAVIVFCILGFPWRLVEIEVPYDHEFVAKLKAKYQRVRDAEKSGILPDPCCAVKSKEAKVCPAREICPVGRLR